MTIVNIEQGSHEWREYRKTKVGASEISYLFGCNPFCRVEDQEKCLIGLKLGFNTIFQNDAMRAGNENEAEIVKFVEDTHGIVTQPLVGYDGEISASFDGITLDHDIVVEVKHSTHTYNEVNGGRIPEHYLLQVQQQLLVSGAEKAIFAAMHTETRDVIMVDVLPDYEVFEQIIKKVKSFFDRMNSQEWKEDDFSEERTDEEFLEAVKDYISAKEKDDAAKKAVNEAKKRLIELSGGVRAKGFGATVYPTKPRETVDYRKLVKDNGIEITDEYKKIGQPSWGIMISDENRSSYRQSIRAQRRRHNGAYTD